MKILYFHQHFTTPDKAGGTRSYEFAKQLLSQGHAVTIVCGETTKLDLPKIRKNLCCGTIDGIDVIQICLPYSNKDSLAKRTITFIKFSWKGIIIALREEYDLLFSTSTPLTAGIPGIAAKLFRRKKFVFEVRDLWPELPKALGMKNPFLLLGMSVLEWMSYRFADACIGLSPGICEGIKRRSQKGKLIKMIPNGCDLELFKPSPRNFLSLDGIKPTDKVAIFAGAHGIANGLDAILDAAIELKRMGRDDILLVFVGEGKEKQRLLDRANQESLNNCRFYDRMPKRKLTQVIASADVGMMVLANVPAFYYGTSPNKFFDYISSGIPVLNNYPGWLADMIEENKLGIVVSPDNPEAFAEGLILLADNDDYRRKLGANARIFAEGNFSRKKLATEFVAFLEDVYFLQN
jgi:glycosyltransferase involved in cell wall biosynthesis